MIEREINSNIISNIEFFIEYMKNSKNASENTLQSYRRDLMAMSKYFAEQNIEDVGRVNSTNINSYILYMERQGKSAATITRSISSIKTFFRCMINHGQVKREPTEQLHTPENERKKTETVTSEDISMIVEQISGNGHKELRDRAMIKLMADTGIKVTELTELKIDDVNLQYAYITSQGRKKAKTIRFSEETLSVLKQYLTEGRAAFIKEGRDESEGRLFLNCFGRKMSRQGFWKVFKEYATLAGVANITTHGMHR